MANYPQSPYPYMQSYQQQPYGMQTQPPQPQQSPQTQLRVVYSEAEARAAQIPIDGATYVFMDSNNDKIYTKRFDYNNGSFPFDVYQRVQPGEVPTEKFVTVQQFEEWKAQIEGMIPKSGRGGAKVSE